VAEGGWSWTLPAVLAILLSLLALGPVSAQPTQALNEGWRAADFNYTSSMLDTDQSDNVYVPVHFKWGNTPHLLGSKKALGEGRDWTAKHAKAAKWEQQSCSAKDWFSTSCKSGGANGRMIVPEATGYKIIRHLLE
jgi:hypothetical protein